MKQSFLFFGLIISISFSISSCGNSEKKEDTIVDEIIETKLDRIIDEVIVTIDSTIIKNVSIEKEKKEEVIPIIPKNPTVKVYDKKKFAFITYEIENFLKWEKFYQEKSDSNARIEYLTNAENESLIGIYEYITSLDDVKKEYQSKQFKLAMKVAGIKSIPKLRVYNFDWVNSKKSNKIYHIAISHEVTDFKKWKKDFFDNAANRGYINIEDLFIATADGNDNLVTVVLGTDNYEMCKSLFTDPEVIAVLKASGVIGELEITYWKVKSY